MYEEHLGHTTTKGYTSGMEPEYGQHLGGCSVESRTSAKASMERKQYIGSWRLRSVTIRKIRRTLPMTATMYVEQVGMAI